MLRKITSGLAISGWWFFVLALVLVAAYLSIGRIIAYSVAANQQQVEDFLHENGFDYVTLGAIEGTWQAFDPRFRVKNLRFGPADESIVEIDELELRLNSLRSFVSRTPIVTEMEVSGVRFTLERDDSGWFSIKGVRRGDGSYNPRYVLDSLPHLQIVRFSGIDIRLLAPDIEVFLRSEDTEPLFVVEKEDRKVISMPLYIERKTQDGDIKHNKISLIGEYQGDLRDPDFQTNLYLDVPDLLLQDYLPDIVVRDKKLSSTVLDASLWVRMRPGDVDITGSLEVTDVRLEDEEEEIVLIESMTTQLRFHGESLTRGNLLIPELSVNADGNNFVLENIMLAANERQVAGGLARFDVTELISLISYASQKGVVPERLGNALAAVNPRGELLDLGFISNRDGSDARLVANVESITMDAFLGVPAISDIDGFVSLQPDRGYLDIHNENFEMNFKNMFSQAWPFTSGRGRISYGIVDGRFNVTSGLIELINGDLTSYGKVVINIPPDRDQQTWGLTIGINNAELLDASRYIPNTIPDNLVEWLGTAVEQGVSREAGLVIHGALFRGSPKVRKAHSVYMKVEDTGLTYHEDWPTLHELAATVHIANHEVTSTGATAEVYDTRISSADVDVPISAGGQVDTVLVNAMAKGPFEDGIRVINETPLAETTNRMARDWSGGGFMDSRIALNVPLGERSGEEVFADVHAVYSGANLVMPEFDLSISDLSGSLDYRNDLGLTSSGFGGKMFSYPVEGVITTELNGAGGEIVVKVHGAIDAADLYEWSDQILLSRAAGTGNYAASVHVPYGGIRDESYVEARSDLEGITIDLPVPFDKPDPHTTHEFNYRQAFSDDGYRVDMSLDEEIKASLKIDDGIAVGGRIHFGSEPLGAVTYDSIRMTGNLRFLDYEKWMNTTDELSAISDVSLEAEMAAHVESVNLDIDELVLFGFSLEQARALVTRGEASWLADIDNEMMSGSVTVPDADDAPIAINLEFLNFVSDGEGGDPLADVEPLSIADIDFSTGKLILDRFDYGNWAFEYRVRDDQARFEKLSANTMGINVQPSSLLEWRSAGEEHTSRFDGEVVVDDLAKVLQNFGFASSIEGQGLKISADMSWPGSPAMIDVNHLVGTVQIEEGKGRFVQAETGGALKLLGIFDFAQLARRFRLDFSDVVSEGYEFNDITGVTSFSQGEIDVKEPIVIESPSSKFTVGGKVNLNTRKLDNDMIVTLPVGRTLPWYAAYSAIATGPLAGAGVMIAQKVFEDQIDQMSSAKYKISGTIEEPDIEFVTIFDDEVRESAQAPAEGTDPVQ